MFRTFRASTFMPTYILIAANILVYVYTSIVGGNFLQTDMRVIMLYGQVNAYVMSGWYWQLLTSMFVHVNIAHLLGNMFFLRMFGRTIEDELQWKKYLFLFGLGAVVSGIFFMATTTKKDIPCVGASGAISAIVGAYFLLFPKAKLRFNIVHPVTFQKLVTTQVSSLYYILSWIIMNVFF